MRPLPRALTVLSSLALLSTLLVAPASAGGPTTRWVDDDGRAGPSNCGGSRQVPKAIQVAVDASSVGDTILVCPGTYVGTVTIGTSNLTVRGVQPWKATLLPRPDHSSNTSLVLIQDTSGVTIQWLNILARTTGTCEQVGGLVTVFQAPRTTIRSNRMGTRGSATLGSCGYESGVRLIDSNRSVIAFNLIQDFKNAGIEARDTNGPVTITRNSVRYFHAGYAPTGYSGMAGIIVQETPQAVISDNRVRNLPTSASTTPVSDGIVAYGSQATITRNKVWYTGSGIAFLLVEGGRIRDNQVGASRIQGIVLGRSVDNRVSENQVSGDGLGIYLWSSSTGNRIHDNDIRGNTGLDCRDESSGTGTDGTANDWASNLADDASPAGICSSPI